MRARQPGLSLGQLHTPELALKNTDLYPIVETGNSDSGCLDNAIEYLTLSRGKSLPETVLSLVPEAWQNDDNMDDQKKEYYKYQGALLEPWDGPALLTFSDGRFVGAVLDRNGLRPSRYYVTRDGFMVMASEVGVYSTPESNVSEKGRLKPGQILLVDTRAQRIIEDAEFKSGLVRHWDEKYCLTIPKLLSASCAKSPVKECTLSGDKLRSILTLFGYTTETLQMLLVPMFQTAKEALGSMGNDAALACVSQQQPLVYDYFKQLFAQVTNPPIDPFREKNVMSLLCPIGIEGDVNNQTAAESCKLWLESPIISPTELAIIKSDTDASLHKNYSVKTVRMIQAQNETLQAAIQRICEAVDAVSTCGMVVLSDKIQDPKTELPVSAALVVGAVHHHLIEVGRRRNCGLIIETAEAREVHQMCVLLGYGADAICPYLIEDIILSLKSEEILSNPEENLTDEDFIEFYFKKYRAAVDRGIFKVMAKMGISTLHSYKGAQIFEALGLADEVVEQCFRGTVSRIGGANFRVLEQESRIRHEKAFATQSDLKVLPDSGFYHMRTGGESHINSPDSIALLQEATKSKEPNKFKQYSEESLKSIQECTLRGQLEIVYADLGNQVPLDEVEPAKEIVKRFVTGAMSYGSISEEAHETLAIAMNSINGKSNTGEGGEDAQRYLNAGAGGPNKRSAIKQIASGRFGVTITYLSNSDEIQIKMAQGAKPGEGGELPGHKVSEGIAKTRNSVPGVGLISPPPHHDIYSIEDLAQLIYDLKCANPKARISVKLVSVAGVGVIAAGVAKGKAEHITISGHDGGTGASSWTGIKGAGLPWELGLSETHQILTKNDLRSRVVVQADGQLRTAFDVAVAAMLGADEFGFSTVPLIAMGCTMMRKCHLNTCPVGIATQDPELRAKFAGKPEHVVEYFFMLAEEIREIMAKVGARNFQDLVGKTEMLRPRENDNSKAQLLDFSKILYNAQKQNPEASILGGSLAQDFGLKNREAANLMMEASEDVLSGKNPGPKTISLKISNADRTFGATLSNQISLLTQGTGYKDGTLNFDLEGHAGQSFGAFLINGVTLNLTGDANDYVGKGLSGGKIVIKPCEDFKPSKEHNSIVGNVCFYGATSGKAFIKGMAGERFCVRNSGAAAVVEGVGDHACEYMTGGIAVILGAVGKNFGAGMSGGIAYVIDVDTTSIDVFRRNLNDDVKNDVEVLRVDELDSEIFSLIKEYETETKSTLAQNILRSEGVRVFKVFPKSYKEALEKLKQKTAVPKKLASDGEPLTIEDAAKEENVNGHSTNGTSNGHATNGTTNGLSKSVADIEDIAGKLDKKTGFKKYKRNTKPYRKIEERSNDYEEIFDHKEVRKDIKKQAARCMDCGVPFCHSTMSGCPLGNIIPKFNDLVFHGKWKEALAQLLQTNNFPEFTGRVCPAPCEGACVLGINEPPVNIKNIECAIIDKGFEMGWIVPKPPKIRNGLKVAVVGSGPSGLSAADQLNKAGYTVTVFEKNNRIGGLLRYGIPSMKLSKDVVQRRVDLMATEGVIFKTNVDIGVDVDAETLKKDHDAVLLCTGAAVPRDLPVPGRKAAIGVNFAMDYLQTSQQHQVGDQVSFDKVDAKGLDVLVIGGGDTGCDCLATAMRQGAKSVTAFEIAEQPGEERAEDNPWPQYPRVYKVRKISIDRDVFHLTF